jgi:drug/metabolite transporter (DMT)-like permease
MLCLILSLFTALAVSSHDAWVKKFFSDLNPYQMAAYPIFYSIPLFFTMSFFAVLNVSLFVLLTLLKKVSCRELGRRPIKGMIAGCLFYLHALFHGYAISLVKAAYMISVKRLSILISVIYGGLIFKESNIKMRFLGTALMLSGAVIIIIKG